MAVQLIHNGAQSYYVDNKDQSPIFLACEVENSEIIEIMCDHDSDGELLTNNNSEN